MNLLEMLGQSMMSSSSVDALAKKTGENPSQIQELIGSALPVLIQAMTNNASTAEGAGSLAEALTQHKETAPVEKQIAKSDEADGEKILGHILGGKQDQVVGALSERSGIQMGSVIKILALLAPIILSGLSAATNQASSNSNAAAGGGFNLSDGIDLGDIFSLFAGGGQAQQQQSGGFGLDLIGSLLGGGSKPQQSGFDGSSLISTLLSVMK